MTFIITPSPFLPLHHYWVSYPPLTWFSYSVGYPPDHINAVITHTVHFLSLLTFYLGIKLPFEISWSGKKLGVGQPFIGAIKGGESGGWAKYYSSNYVLENIANEMNRLSPDGTRSILSICRPCPSSRRITLYRHLRIAGHLGPPPALNGLRRAYQKILQSLNLTSSHCLLNNPSHHLPPLWRCCSMTYHTWRGHRTWKCHSVKWAMF